MFTLTTKQKELIEELLKAEASKMKADQNIKSYATMSFHQSKEYDDKVKDRQTTLTSIWTLLNSLPRK